MDLPELRWQYSPSKTALGAGLSQMALPVHQLLDYITFLLPRYIMVWKSRSVIETKLRGILGRFVSRLADCCLALYAVVLRMVARLKLMGISVLEVTVDDVSELQEVVNLIERDKASFAEVHDVRWLKWHLAESFSNRGSTKLHVAKLKGIAIGFYMTKSRFHEQASHRGFRDVWLGSIIEWQMLPEYGEKLKWLLVDAALRLKSDGMDAVEIAIANLSLHRFFKRVGWRQVGDSNFVIKAGEKSPLNGNAELAKIENWRIRPAMGDNGLS